MFRIGILGSENSHALTFSKIFNGIDRQFEGEFDDISVVGTFGTDDAANQTLLKEGGVSFVADRPEDLLGRVDAVMVTARDGRYHAEYARPFIEAGLPAFIDKPFCADALDAVALARLAKEKQVPLCGGSSLTCSSDTLTLAAFAEQNRDTIITGSVAAPVSMKNDYGNFYFYASHLVEISLMTFGYDPQWVYADEMPEGVTAMIHYDRYTVANHFLESMYQYAGTVVTKNEIYSKNISLKDAFIGECRTFAEMLRTGRMPTDYEKLVQPVYYINAIERAMQTGIREVIPFAVI